MKAELARPRRFGALCRRSWPRIPGQAEHGKTGVAWSSSSRMAWCFQGEEGWRGSPSFTCAGVVGILLMRAAFSREVGHAGPGAAVGENAPTSWGVRSAELVRLGENAPTSWGVRSAELQVGKSGVPNLFGGFAEQKKPWRHMTCRHGLEPKPRNQAFRGLLALSSRISRSSDGSCRSGRPISSFPVGVLGWADRCARRGRASKSWNRRAPLPPRSRSAPCWRGCAPG